MSTQASSIDKTNYRNLAPAFVNRALYDLRPTLVGLVIDAFRERMEAIVRPLEGALAGVRGFAGTTLLGDGRVLRSIESAQAGG